MAIPSIDGAHLLERMLPTLRIDPASVVVLDQGSRDDTARICAEAGVELLQLSRPHTYTEACNLGVRLARERGFSFVCLSNNDITFRTNVLEALLEEMDRDPRLAIAAPSQVIIDPSTGTEVATRRVGWDLEMGTFLHDTGAEFLPPRLEADFCELTCALIRLSALDEIGLLDEDYGFYFEDADLGFRLREAGYGAAYLPRAQILHFTSSTFRQRRQEQLDYMRRNRVRFAQKHLGYGVRIVPEAAVWPGESATAAQRLAPVLRRFGLYDSHRPELTIGRVGAVASGYLLTPQASAAVPARWISLSDRYRAVFATSEALTSALRGAGFTSFRVPLGIEPDIFNPWCVGAERFEELTCIAFPDPHDPAPFARILTAWMSFLAEGGAGRLVMVGARLSSRMGRAADRSYRSGDTEVSDYHAERVTLHEVARPLTDAALAALYRSADFTLIAGAEGSSFTLLETLACGTPVLFDAGCAATAAMYREATGLEPIANNTGGLAGALRQGFSMAAHDRLSLATAARYGVLNRATLRHSAMALRIALAATQERAPLFTFQTAADPETPLAGASSTTSLRVLLSGAMARKVTRAATLAAQFGTLWQYQGLPAAVLRSAGRVRSAMRRRLPTPRDVSLAGPVPLAAPSQPAEAPPESTRSPTPLLIGYIDAQLGIGQSLRGLALALEQAGAAFSIYPFGVGVETRRSIPFMPERRDETTPHDVNIIEVSPDELPRVFANVSESHFKGSINILRTYWELARGPAAWRQGFGMERVDEIWAPNEFCAQAFRDFFDGPITVVPPCLDVVAPSAALTQEGRERFDLAPDIFHFMFSFDYFSFPDRKNPLAVIRAFMGAFPDPASPVALVMKASGAEGHYSDVKQAILAAAQADGRIKVIDRSLSRRDMIALMAGIDSYVSLHRSEGFGLGLAEAMMMEKPVIATDYSASAEFVSEETAYPIPYTLGRVRSDQYVHTEGQVWAYPDEDAAVAAMRAVVSEPSAAAARARAGRAFVLSRYSAVNVGRIATDRLAAIASTQRPRI